MDDPRAPAVQFRMLTKGREAGSPAWRGAMGAFGPPRVLVPRFDAEKGGQDAKRHDNDASAYKEAPP